MGEGGGSLLCVRLGEVLHHLVEEIWQPAQVVEEEVVQQRLEADLRRRRRVTFAAEQSHDEPALRPVDSAPRTLYPQQDLVGRPAERALDRLAVGVEHHARPVRQQLGMHEARRLVSH